jgi:hypothetical protein
MQLLGGFAELERVGNNAKDRYLEVSIMAALPSGSG